MKNGKFNSMFDGLANKRNGFGPILVVLSFGLLLFFVVCFLTIAN